MLLSANKPPYLIYCLQTFLIEHEDSNIGNIQVTIELEIIMIQFKNRNIKKPLGSKKITYFGNGHSRDE